MVKKSYYSLSVSGYSAKRAYKTDPRVYPPAQQMVGSTQTNCANCINCCPSFYPYGPYYFGSYDGNPSYCQYNSNTNESCCCDPTTGNQIACGS